MRAHDQRRSLEGKAGREGVGFDDEYACTYIQGYMDVYIVSVWCALCRGT